MILATSLIVDDGNRRITSCMTSHDRGRGDAQQDQVRIGCSTTLASLHPARRPAAEPLVGVRDPYRPRRCRPGPAPPRCRAGRPRRSAATARLTPRVRSLGEVLAQYLGASEVHVHDVLARSVEARRGPARARPGAALPSMSSSWAQSSGTSPIPRVRAAAAGKALRRSGVLVKTTLMRSSVVSAFRSRICGHQLDDRVGHLDRVVGGQLGRSAECSNHSLTLAASR